MVNLVKMSFEPEGVVLPIDQILPGKKVKSSIKKSGKYKRIVASIREIGIIEPLNVFPFNGKEGNFLLLDGHMRLEALKELDQEEVLCLVSTDDEEYTKKTQFGSLNAIQEHYMIGRVIKKGVRVDRIAKVLNIDAKKIEQKSKLLDNICQEAQVLLKDKSITADAIRIFKKVIPIRQIEMAELMIAANNFTLPYTKALFAATPQNKLIKQENSKKISGITAEDMARMEREMENVKQDFK
ncbi:plasmid partitioning protein RepB C-terminal domain-containing protein, partial [Thermodesulfobacteriota bacterium]